MDFSWTPFLNFFSIEGTTSSGLKMYLVENKVGAIACMLLSLFFLGTWPAIFTFLERRGRLPQHTYLDYSITNLLAAVFIAFTLGEIGKGTTDSPNFLDQLSQDNWPSVLFALAGGALLSLGNLATQYALALVGLSVTLVITCSTTVVIGTTINYFLDNKINNAEILFPGVGCFFIAVCLASAVHASNADDTKMKLDQSGLGNIDAKTSSFSALKGVHQNDGRTLIHYAVTELSIKLIPFPENSNFGSSSLPALTLGFFTEDMENASGLSEKVEVGTADSLIELEYRRAIKVLGRNTLFGLGIAFFGGVCFALFSPAFNLATNDQWHTLKEGVPHLTVYTAFFYFSISCFIVAAVLNVSFLYHPILNLPRSSFKTYSSDWNGRGWALLAGLLCGFGNGLQFMGGEAAGYAAADAVQALPLVSTFWGILLFGEYRRSSRRTYVLLVSMLFMFVVAVALLIASAGQRSVTATA